MPFLHTSRHLFNYFHHYYIVISNVSRIQLVFVFTPEQALLYSHSLLFIHDMLKNSGNSFIFVTIMSCRFSLQSYIDLFHLLAFIVSNFRVSHFGENLILSISNISRYILKHFQTKTLRKITGAP